LLLLLLFLVSFIRCEICFGYSHPRTILQLESGIDFNLFVAGEVKNSEEEASQKLLVKDSLQ